jgi:DDE superfamily endonuclease
VLVAGAVLAPGKRTVTQELRHGPGRAGRFSPLPRRTEPGALGCTRLGTAVAALLDQLLPGGPVVIGIDDTIERRWGAKIKARGIYRDRVRSSKGHFVKTSGLRWLSLMAVLPIR